MREIKFRAWLKKERKMIDVISIDFQNKCIYFAPIDEQLREFSKLDDSKYAILSTRNFDEIELMQFTEMHDKNGIEILDNDIIQIKVDCLDKNLVGVIKFGTEEYEYNFENKYSYGFYIDFPNHKTLKSDILFWIEKGVDIEVIGNIYQNKNLLDGK